MLLTIHSKERQGRVGEGAMWRIFLWGGGSILKGIKAIRDQNKEKMRSKGELL